MQKSPLTAQVYQAGDTPEEWAIEAIDHDGDGSIEHTIFIGPDCRERALECARERYKTVIVEQARLL